MGFLSGCCSIFLMIYNLFLMIAGIIIMIKGLYLLAYGHQIKQQLGIFSLGIDNIYKEIGMSYVVPAAIMIVIAYFGCKAARFKTKSIIIYIGLIVLQMSGSTYGISKLSNQIAGRNDVFSVFSYINKLVVSSELGSLGALAYPEMALQIALLIASLYLLYHNYNEKRKIKKLEKLVKQREQLQALLYIGLIVLQMSGSTYGISKLSNQIAGRNDVFSVFSYINKLVVSSELGSLGALAYPEMALQIALLIASLYLLYHNYNEKRKIKKLEKLVKQREQLQALLVRAEKTRSNELTN